MPRSAAPLSPLTDALLYAAQLDSLVADAFEALGQGRIGNCCPVCKLPIDPSGCIAILDGVLMHGGCR